MHELHPDGGGDTGIGRPDNFVDFTAPYRTTTDHSQLLPPHSEAAGSAENFSSELPPDAAQLAHLFQRVESVNNKLFAAFAHDTGTAEGTFTARTIGEQQYAVALYRELGTPAFTRIMQGAGLGIMPDKNTPSLEITDGERFIGTLQAVERPRTQLTWGAEAAITHSLSRIVEAYVPPTTHERYNTFHINPYIAPHLKTDAESYQRYCTAVIETAAHSAVLAGIITTWHGSKDTIASLHSAQNAYRENKLPAWAIAQHWDLFRAPTANDEDLVWTQWTGYNDWSKLFAYFDTLISRQSEQSPFISQLARVLAANVRNKRLHRSVVDGQPVNPGNVLMNTEQRLMNIAAYYATR